MGRRFGCLRQRESSRQEVILMPWKRAKGGGYTTSRGGRVGRPKQYEALRRQGMSKGRAARITNAQSGRRRGR